MKKSTFYVSALFSILSGASAIWPLPTTYNNGSTVLWLAPDVNFEYSPANTFHFSLFDNRSWQSWIFPQSKNDGSSSDVTIVQDAIKRTRETLFTERFVPWKFHPRNVDFEPSIDGNETFITTISIQQTSSDSKGTPDALAGKIDESYTIHITEGGKVTIAAAKSNGILHALNTFTQLFFQHSQGARVYTPFAPVQIEDRPRYPYRGLNLDVARNWFPPSALYRTLDALAWNKFNVLHLHVTDAQSWPLEIPALPELAAKGAYRKDLTYSPAELSDIQSYAANRGIQVILEIDLPGHTSSIRHSTPDLIVGADLQPTWATYAAEPPSGQLKLKYGPVESFLDTLFKDLLPRLSSHSAYFHTGGDEVNKNIYKLEDTVHSVDPTTLKPLLQAFVDRVHSSVRAHGLTPIVWEEMLLDWNLTLGKDVVVQTWQSEKAVTETVKKRHKVIFGDNAYWYLDCGHGSWLLPSTPASAPANINNSFTDYCNPYKPWQRVYTYNPPASDSPLVLGGEVHLWSELTDDQNLDSKLWPRAAAAGEVLWRGGGNATAESMQRVGQRLAVWRERMVARGVRASLVQMIFCTMGGGVGCGPGV